MELVSLHEASRQLGVAHDTLRAQIHRGKLLAVKIGRDWLVSQAEIERYRNVSKRPPR
jgi:excisionase family DNA binding protein